MSQHGDLHSTLAWPDHDAGPEPEPERPTRKPLAFWDRVKFLVLIAVVFALLVWSAMADNPILPFGDAVRETLRSKWWVVLLFGLEVVRQLHYYVSERSPAWYHFWNDRVFGGIEQRTGRLNDWNRYRIARAAKWLVVVLLVAIVAGAITHESPAEALFALPRRLWDLLPMILQLVLTLFIVVGQFAAIFWFLSRGGVDVYFPDDIKTRFTDVWGQDAVLAHVKENMLFLEDPESIEDKGGYVPGGLLLWGPPGTGKTLMAEAVAGETGKPFVFVDPGAFINMFMGVGILKVKSLFRKVRKLAVRYGGVIVFFDEADSLGNRGQLGQGGFSPGMKNPAGPFQHTQLCNGLNHVRQTTGSLLLEEHLRASTGEVAPQPRRFIMGGGMGGGGGMGTLQALLTELSGLKKPRGFINRVVRRGLGMKPKPPPKYRILVMMATNMPEALDEALLRPGRIDRIYRVGYPSKMGRVKTYEGYFDKVNHQLTHEQIERLATITPYATGATIKDLVNESLIVAIRDGRETITWQDVLKAKILKSLGPPEDVEYIERERHATAVHEACHAVAQYLLQKHMGIELATIEKGQSYLGMVKPVPLEEQFTSWRTEYDTEIMVFLASLAGERMFFEGDNSSGVSGDLQSATSIAMYMEGYWGMGTAVGSHAATKAAGPNAMAVVGSEDMLESSLGHRVETRLRELFKRAEQLLIDNRHHILAIAHALETHKTITGEDVEAIIEGRPGPLVDGTLYHRPDFIEVAEEYHREVVTAHQGKARVAVPLPVFKPFVPEPEAASRPYEPGNRPYEPPTRTFEPPPE